MKKLTTLIIALLTTFTIIQADELTGQAVFDSKCVACHTEQMPEKMSDLKAPPMSRISAKLKHAFDDNKTQFVEFITDYIQNPSEEKAKCMARAIKNFGLMPPIGKAMSEEERQAVATWMFDNFDEKWETKGKCGEGKCDGDKNATKKCGAGKCGAGKCGGKCGGK